MHPDVTELLATIGIRADRESLASLLNHAKEESLPADALFVRLVELERAERDRRNLARRTVAATIGDCAPLDRFDWAWPRSIDRALYTELCSLDFIDRGENVLFRGPTGVGKSTLAKNLGTLALARGYSVRCVSLVGALGDILGQESIPAAQRRIKRYLQPDLLILDELGYLPQDTRAGDALYNIVAQRHERASTIITTNRPYKEWAQVFPSAACITALVDRFAQHCHTMDIDADTWRARPRSADGLSTTRSKKKSRRR
jgi:DNA replication protein DnaC